jgi:predicted membrane protein
MRGRAFVGLIVTVFGVLLLLESTGAADTGGVWQYLPSVFIVLGLYRLVRNGFKNLIGPLVMIVIASLVQLSFLGFDVWDSAWPVIIIIVGVSILLGGTRARGRRRSGSGHNISDSNRVGPTAILGGTEERNRSKDFQGGQVTVFMGGVELDLREAEVIEKPARIELTVVMGGVEIYLPSHWVVKKDVLPIMGGVNENRTVVRR